MTHALFTRVQAARRTPIPAWRMSEKYGDAGDDVHSLGSVSPCPSLPVLESFNTPVSQSSSHAEEVVPGSVDSWEHGHGLAEFLESEGIWF